MKKAFFKTLFELAGSDPRVQFIKGDTAYVPDFQRAYPGQYLDVGIAEQDMIGVAAGMALEGFRPFTYSIVNFAVMRCLEQIRNDIAYHRLPVTVVSCGAGFDYGNLGATHHATEDLALMRSMPNMTVFSPADSYETAAVTRTALMLDGPSFIRNGHGGERILHPGPIEDFKPGRALLLRTGTDAAIFATGSIAADAIDAAEELEVGGISVSVWSFPTVKPLDRELVLKTAAEMPLIVTLEEHNRTGGFGSAVAEVLAETRGAGAVLTRLGIPDVFPGEVGSKQYLKHLTGIDAMAVVKAISAFFGRQNG